MRPDLTLKPGQSVGEKAAELFEPFLSDQLAPLLVQSLLDSPELMEDLAKISDQKSRGVLNRTQRHHPQLFYGYLCLGCSRPIILESVGSARSEHDFYHGTIPEVGEGVMCVSCFERQPMDHEEPGP